MLIFAFLYVVQIAGLANAADLTGSRSVPEVNRMQQDQEIPADIPKIKVDVALATTDVTVIGNAVSELNADDFLIYDNGVPQKISHFSRDVMPLSVVVLIDRSESIAEYLPKLENAAISALGHLKPQDQVALLAFDDDVLKLSEFTQDRNRIARILGKLTIGSATNIYDAIGAAAGYLRTKAPNSRHAIIMLSDDCHTVTGGSGDRAQIEVLKSSTTLYSIRTPGKNYAEEMRERDPVCHDSIVLVKKIAEETGGEVLDVSNSRSLQAALEKAISNLRLQYTLGFSPTNLGEDESFHKLTVKLASEGRCPGCQLLTRSGYFAGIRAPSPAANRASLIPAGVDERIDPSLIRRRILAVGNIDADLPDISFTVKTAELKKPDGKQQIKIDLQVSFAGVGFKTAGNLHSCRLHIAVFYVDKKRDYVESEWQTLEGQLTEETYNRIVREGLSFSIAVPQKTREQNLRVVVYDEATASFGSKLVHFLQQ